jgi:hypothetical protein
MSVLKARDSFKENIKVLNKTTKSLKSKVNNPLVQKNDHDFRMQKMKNDYKQMVGLDELYKKLTNKKAGGTSSGPMSLEEKKDGVTRQAFVKQASKDNDLAQDYQQKEIKKKDTQCVVRGAEFLTSLEGSHKMPTDYHCCSPI